jgi:Cu/Ag efflux protein CusF
MGTTRIGRAALAFAALCMVLAGCSTLGGEAPKPKGEISGLTSATATVVAIDAAARRVTLRGSDGREFTVKVGEQVKNLPQVRVGDVVDLSYYESLVWSVRKPGQAAPAATAAGGVASAPPGEKPAALAGATVTVTATIDAIDPGAGTVTLRGPRGGTQTIKARDPNNLRAVKVGDLVEITYTEALAVDVHEADATD